MNETARIGVLEEPGFVQGKQKQAINALNRHDIDVWLVFVREGTEGILTSLITGVEYIVQNAVFMLTAEGKRIAILEPIDIQNGAGTFYDTVISYDYDIAKPLRQIIRQLAPKRVALNYSRFEYAADGLSHSMYLRLIDALEDLGFSEKIVSAKDIIVELRAVKTPQERERLRKAADISVQIHKEMTEEMIRPNVKDSELVRFVETRAVELGADAAHTSLAINPLGSNKKGIQNKLINAGETIVSDMIVLYGGYSSDVKWLWFVVDKDHKIPEKLIRQWEACRASFEAGLRALLPGRHGYEVHEEAWAVLEEYGFPRDKHSYGHQVGHGAHDAGPWLGERENLYRPSEGVLKNGMIVTLDPTINRVGVPDPSLYCVGLEVMAEVTDSGGVPLHEDQKEIWTVKF
jgi:Xaa-Pro aminopeptidase